MKLSEMLIKFRLLAQKMEMQTVLYILDEEIVELFNITIPEYARDIFSRKRNRELNGVSDNVVRLAELEPLYKNFDITTITTSSVLFGKGYNITKPSDCMFLLNVNVKYEDTISDSRLLDIEKVTLTINDYHSKPTKESPVCYINSNSVEVIDNVQTATGVIISYIKVPNKVALATPTTDEVGCELPDFAVEDIIKRTVNLYNAASDNSSYEKVAVETQKLE